MEEEFRKESDGKTYLLLKRTRVSFEERMIQRVKPAGVIPMVKSEQEDAYKYEITGKKNLSMTFERVPMNAEQIEKILYGILDVLKEGREFLLTEDNFILCPDHIYLRIPEYEVSLCYYPEYGIPFAEQMGKLFEMLLNRVDYREEKAIAMVYALYMQLQEPDMTLERIREKLGEQVMHPVQRVAEGSEGEERRRERREVKAEEPGSVRTKEGVVMCSAEKGRQKKKKLWERLRTEVNVKRVVFGEKNEIPLAIPCVRETGPEWEPQYTKVLSVRPQEAHPYLVSQKDGEKIVLSKFPFYVGSLPGYMDYVIVQDTVSRFHAKFIQQGQAVYLVDLNSTNGTKINGRTLNVREQGTLKNGDNVTFADCDYVYWERE